jgi:hypothetical protein
MHCASQAPQLVALDQLKLGARRQATAKAALIAHLQTAAQDSEHVMLHVQQAQQEILLSCAAAAAAVAAASHMAVLREQQLKQAPAASDLPEA